MGRVESAVRPVIKQQVARQVNDVAWDFLQFLARCVNLPALPQGLLVRLQHLGVMGLSQGIDLALQVRQPALQFRSAFQLAFEFAQARSLRQENVPSLFETTIEIADLRRFVDDIKQGLSTLPGHGRNLALREQPDRESLRRHYLAG